MHRPNAEAKGNPSFKKFPFDELLNCELKKGSSYIWQSIYAGLQTFKKGKYLEGCEWSGNKYFERLLDPYSSSRKIITSRGNRVLTRVHELINPAT